MKKYVENTTDQTIYVSGKAIPPGEGREVDVPETRIVETEDEPDHDADLRDLLKGNVAVVKESLKDLSLDTLNRLTELEAEALKPRTGVLTALEDARLALANAKLTDDEI